MVDIMTQGGSYGAFREHFSLFYKQEAPMEPNKAV